MCVCLRAENDFSCAECLSLRLPLLSRTRKKLTHSLYRSNMCLLVCLFGQKKMYLPFSWQRNLSSSKHTRVRMHTHTHTHTSPFLSLSLYHLKNQDLSLEFLVLKKSWRLLLTEKGPELSVTHTHAQSHMETHSRKNTVCVSTHPCYPLCTPTCTHTYIREETCPPPTKSVALENQASFFLVLGLQKICLQMENAFFF